MALIQEELQQTIVQQVLSKVSNMFFNINVFSTSMFFQRQCLSTSFIYDIHHDVLGIVSKHQAARFRTVSRL
jgi:hypothetical protein